MVRRGRIVVAEDLDCATMHRRGKGLRKRGMNRSLAGGSLQYLELAVQIVGEFRRGAAARGMFCGQGDPGSLDGCKALFGHVAAPAKRVYPHTSGPFKWSERSSENWSSEENSLSLPATHHGDAHVHGRYGYSGFWRVRGHPWDARLRRQGLLPLRCDSGINPVCLKTKGRRF